MKKIIITILLLTCYFTYAEQTNHCIKNIDEISYLFHDLKFEECLEKLNKELDDPQIINIDKLHYLLARQFVYICIQENEKAKFDDALILDLINSDDECMQEWLTILSS